MKDLKLLGSRTGQFYGDFNDISYDVNGNAVMVSGTAYARQAITKILLTALGRQPFPTYGTILPGLIQQLSDPDTLSTQISSTILEALTQYNVITVAAGGLPSEIINQVESVQVALVNLSAFEVQINLLMQDGTRLFIPLGS